MTATLPPFDQLTYRPCWQCVAEALFVGAPLPPTPLMYQPHLLRALYYQDTDQALYAMRFAGGWAHAPHSEHELLQLLNVWEHGHPPDEDLPDDEPEGHFVSDYVAVQGFDESPHQVCVAQCKDCGIPLYAVGVHYRHMRNPDEPAGWQRVWPTIQEADQ